MVTDPQVKIFLQEITAKGSPPFEQRTPAQARVAEQAVKPLNGEPEAVARVL